METILKEIESRVNSLAVRSLIHVHGNRVEEGFDYIDVLTNLSVLKGEMSAKLKVHEGLTTDEALSYTPDDDEDFDVSGIIETLGLDRLIKTLVKDHLRKQAQEKKNSMSDINQYW